LPTTPYEDAGPLYGMMLPILISVSVAPVSYFFWAKAPPLATANVTIAADIAATLRVSSVEDICFLVTFLTFVKGAQSALHLREQESDDERRHAEERAKAAP
jgi:hypothetical protein